MSDHELAPINHIERKPGSNKYRVVGKGVTVDFLAQFINDPEWSVERICENYDLTPAEVFSAWAFYFDHKEEIDRSIQEVSTTTQLDEQEAARRKTLIEQYERKTGKSYSSQDGE